MAAQDGYDYGSIGAPDFAPNQFPMNDQGTIGAPDFAPNQFPMNDQGTIGAPDFSPNESPHALLTKTVGMSAYPDRRPDPMLEATVNTAVIASIFMRDAVTGLGTPGLASLLTIQQKKAGAGFLTITPTITDRGNGRYDLLLTSSHGDTPGLSDFHVTAPNALVNDELQINYIAVNKQDAVRFGLSALPNAAAGTTSGLPLKSDIPVVILDALRSGHVTTGTIGEGIAIASSLLQGNFFMDTVTNTSNGQTAARIRCFHNGAATAAATAGGSGEGEFATFLVTTTYAGPNKIISHRVVQQ